MPTSNSNPATSHHAEFRRKGWTYRSAANRLGVDVGHLYRVLTGERESRRLLSRVASLPRNKPTKPTAK